MNVVTGADDVLAYGDVDLDKSSRYDRTREFLQLVRRRWTEEDVARELRKSDEYRRKR